MRTFVVEGFKFIHSINFWLEMYGTAAIIVTRNIRWTLLYTANRLRACLFVCELVSVCVSRLKYSFSDTCYKIFQNFCTQHNFCHEILKTEWLWHSLQQKTIQLKCWKNSNFVSTFPQGSLCSFLAQGRFELRGSKFWCECDREISLRFDPLNTLTFAINFVSTSNRSVCQSSQILQRVSRFRVK